MNDIYFIELADYNIWANDIVLTWLDAISETQWHQPIVSSFGSIADTTLHIAGAESIWFDRLSQIDVPKWIPATFKGDKSESLDLLKKTSFNLKSFLLNFDFNRMQEVISFHRINGESEAMSFYQIFAHVFNHSTYHRGQLVTMLRQVGFEGVSSTDLLRYYRHSVVNGNNNAK